MKTNLQILLTVLLVISIELGYAQVTYPPLLEKSINSSIFIKEMKKTEATCGPKLPQLVPGKNVSTSVSPVQTTDNEPAKVESSTSNGTPVLKESKNLMNPEGKLNGVSVNSHHINNTDSSKGLLHSGKAPKVGYKTFMTGGNINNKNGMEHKGPVDQTLVTYGVYGIINNFVGGTDADNDNFYETYTFQIGVDADATPGPITIYAKMICNTTGQSWWSSSPWAVAGTTTDYHYFSFSQADFSGYVTGNTNLDFTVEIWNSSKTTLLATDATVTGEPVKADYIAQTSYAVYGIINNFVGGTDADNDTYYETYSFQIGVDGDATPGPTTIYAKMICNTTGQSWWSSSPWAVTGTTTDYHYFNFSQADFSGYVTGNTSLDFTVEIWNQSKTSLLATDATVTGEPVKADYIAQSSFAVYGIINNFVGGTDVDNDTYYETYTFQIGVDADATPGPITVYAKMICNTTGQSWWSSSPWAVAGSTTDYHYFNFSQTDFSGYVTGNTSLDFTVEIWNQSKTSLLATDATVTGEPVKADYIAPTTYAVYGIVNNFIGGTDADNDTYYETFTFQIGVDGDAIPGPATIYAKMICTTTGQSWWSASSWPITGSVTDYHYFNFDQTDFASYVTGNTNLDFTVELWNATKTTLLASDGTVTGEPIKADFILSTPNISVTPSSITINQTNPAPLQGQSGITDSVLINNPTNQGTQEAENDNIQIHGRGLIVPDSVTQYWESHPMPNYSLPTDNTVSVMDWSNQDSPVKNQLSCGSCWAFAAVALLENLGLQTDLSEQDVVSCNSAGDNCSGGWHWNALALAASTGIPPESCYPYVANNGSCANQCSTPAFREKVTSYTPAFGLWGETTTVANLKAILNTGPAIVTMIVPEDGTFDSYPGGVYNYSGGVIPWNGNAHAILCVGYDDNAQYFKVKNSWGPNWGESGYFRIAFSNVTGYVHFGGYAVQAQGVYSQYLTGDVFTIQNTGTGALTVNSITDNANWLNTSTSPSTPFNLAPGASQQVTLNVNWAQVNPPQQTATVTVSSNDPDSPNYQVSVTAVPLSDVIISGTVMDNNGNAISGVSLTFSGNGGGTTTTNSSGQYSFTVNSGYNGTVTPTKPCYSFNPTYHSYTNVTTSQTSQNYTGTSAQYEITGTITNAANQVIPGVTVSFSGTGGGNATTNGSGQFLFSVPCGYSGNATPTLSGFSFNPSTRNFSNVSSTISNQDFVGSTSQVIISGTISDASNQAISGVSVNFTGAGGTVSTNSFGQYSITVPSGYTGVATPSKDCFAFLPTSRTFSNIVTDQSNQNFSGTSGGGIPGAPDPIIGSNNICAGQSVNTYSVTPINGAISYVWTLPGGATGTSTTNSIQVTFGPNANSGNITVRGHNTCGDGPVSNLQIMTHQPAVVNAGADQTINLGNSATLSVTATGGTAPYTYLWSNGVSSQNIAVSPTLTTTYLVTVTDVNGCTGSDAVVVTVVSGVGLTTTVPIMNACPGNIVIPITVNNFNGVAAVSLSLPYNVAVLTYSGYQNANPALSSGMLLVNSNNNNKVQIAWFSTTPANIGSGTLLELKFTGVSGSSPLNWDLNTPGACQYSDINNNTIPASFVNGNVSLGSCSNLEGIVSYNNTTGSAMNNTVIYLKQGGVVVNQSSTDNQGHYLFSNLSNGTYTLDGTSTKAWGGVNASDALLILKHFVGTSTLIGVRYFAGDVDGTGYVNSGDALLAAKRFVGLTNSFSVGDWVFKKDTVIVSNAGNITKNVQSLCYGDVDGSYTPAAKIEPSVSLNLNGALTVAHSKDIEIPIYAMQSMQIGAISLILDFPYDCMNIKNIFTTNGGNLVYSVVGNEVRIAWYSIEPVDITQGDPLLTLVCHLTGIGEKSMSHWDLNPGSQIADGNGVIINDVKLAVPDLNFTADNFSLGQNQPNPFTMASDIPYYLPEQGRVILKVYDIIGNEIMTLVDQTQEAGTYKATIQAGSLPAAVYFYKIEISGSYRYFNETRQMVVGK